MKKNLYTFCCLLLSLALSAQNAKIQGRVTDEKGEPLISARIVIDAAKGQAAVTDYDGNYELSVPAGSYDVVYGYVGKDEQKIHITLAANQTYIQVIALMEKSSMMNQVVVSASKYERKLSEETVSMEVMKGNQLNEQNVTSLDNGIQKIPSVTIADGQANIRGGSGWSYGAGTRVAVLYDGLPISTADANDAKWSMIPMENIEQVEVIKGAASALYGSGAMNGVINAISAWPSDKPYTRIQAYGGFYGDPPNESMKWWGPGAHNFPYMDGVNYVDRRKLGQFDLVTSAGYTNDQGYLDSSRSSDAHIDVKFRWRVKKVEGLSMGINVIAYYSWGQTFFVWDSTGSKGYRPLPGSITQYTDGRYLVDPFINYIDKHDNHFSFKYRYLNSSNINSTQQGSIGNRNYMELQYGKMLKKIDLNIVSGVVGIYDLVHSPKGDSSSLVGNHNMGNFAVYTQIDKKFITGAHTALNLTLGGRWEYYNVDDTISGNKNGRRNSLSDLKYPLGRAGINFQAAQATFLRASAGMAFRYPSIAEMYINTRIGNELGVYSNPRLEPEKGYSAEVGARQGVKFSNNWVGYGDVALFLSEYRNMLEFTFGQFGIPLKDPSFGLGFSSQNIGAARIMGTDISAGLQGKMGDLNLTFVAGYTYIDPRSLNWNDTLHLYTNAGLELPRQTYAATSTSKDNLLKYRSRNQLKLLLTLNYKFIEFNADYQYIGYQENIDEAFVGILATQSSAFSGLANYRDQYAAKGNKGYNILNLGLAFRATKHFKIGGIVRNVTNTEWMTRPGMFQAPINYTMQLTYVF